MKIAILSDIHGNQYALKQVLDCARRDNIEQLYILGDFVGYYYSPEVVLSMLKDWQFSAIKGNHEDILDGLLKGSLDKQLIQNKYGNGHNKAISNLSKDRKEFLINLPSKLTVEIEGISIMLTHGSPWDKDFYLYPDTKEDILSRCDFPGIDFVFSGHSHYAFCRRNHHSMFVNVGSVGQSRNQTGLAQWTVLNTETKTFEMRSAAYDTTELLTEIEDIDPENNYLKDVLTRKR